MFMLTKPIHQTVLKPNFSVMELAIAEAEKHQTPFGAAIAMGGEVIVSTVNQTNNLHDPTAHAEIMALRKSGQYLQKTDFSGYHLYTTCEPCPMCAAAAVWAKLDAVFFGCTIEQVSEYRPQIHISCNYVRDHGFHSQYIKGGIAQNSCLELLKKFPVMLH